MCVGELANMGIFLNINIQYTGQTGVVHLSIIGINVTNPLCVCLCVCVCVCVCECVFRVNDDNLQSSIILVLKCVGKCQNSRKM